jgi:hypothetical protein
MNNKNIKIINTILLLSYLISFIGFTEIDHICHGTKHFLSINSSNINCDCQHNCINNEHSITVFNSQSNCCKNIVKYYKIDDSQIKNSSNIFFLPALLSIIFLTTLQFEFFSFKHINFLIPNNKHPIYIKNSALLI